MYQYECKWRNIEELPEMSDNISKKKLQQSWYCYVFVIIYFFVQWTCWPRLNSFQSQKHRNELPVCIKWQSAVRSMWSLIKYLLHWKKTLNTYIPAIDKCICQEKEKWWCPLATKATSPILYSSRKNSIEILQVYSYCTKNKDTI